MGTNGVSAPAQLPPVVIPKRGGQSANEPIKCLVYNDPFSCPPARSGGRDDRREPDIEYSPLPGNVKNYSKFRLYI